MTTMDSDSESQDSDDGRRFRFEATRKDHLLPERRSDKSSKSNSERRSYSDDAECKNRRDKSKRNCDRDEYRTSRERDTDGSRSSALTWKHKTRDAAKRHRNRDREEHRKSRSHERSRSRNDNDRHQNDKHKNKSHEKYKRHSRDRSRDRGYHKTRSEDHDKTRGETERYNACKKASTKEIGEESSQESWRSPRSVERDRNDNDNDNELIKEYRSTDNQECKELNLSEFDILSETDENVSDSSEMKNKSTVLQPQKRKMRKRDSNDEHDGILNKATEIEHSEGLTKVNARMNEPLHGSSNNNSGTISGFTLTIESAISMEENIKNCDSPNTKHVSSLLSHASNESDSIYGPNLPPRLVTDSSNDVKPVKNTVLIGPCLPEDGLLNISKDSGDDATNTNTNETIEQHQSAFDSDVIFGPALPPHLLKSKCDDKANSDIGEIIGPALPTTTRSFDDNDKAEETESENEDTIGPLPADHPSLTSNYAYRQLEQRALEIQAGRKDQADGTKTQSREEWMTELPSVQISDLGLTARKFRAKPGPDMSDRSCWTDTPAKKAAKRKEKESETSSDTSIPSLAEETFQVNSKESRTKEEKSLLEIHQSKLRKKKKKEEKRAKLSGETIRRPFDRDVDLQINRFDQAQRNAVINKAQYLNERFSRGKL